MYGMAGRPYRGGERAIGSGGQQDPDAVQPARLTSQEERSLSPRRRRIHSSSCSQQHLHTAGGEQANYSVYLTCIYQCARGQTPMK